MNRAAVVVAVLATGAIADAATIAVADRAPGQPLALALAAMLAPALVRGAGAGWLRPPTAWLLASGAGLLPAVATTGVDAATTTPYEAAWWVGAALGAALLLHAAGRTPQAALTVLCLVVHGLVWAGPSGLLRLGIAGWLVLLAAAVLAQHALRRIARSSAEAAERDRVARAWEIEQDAIHLDRQLRLHLAGRDATPMLERIAESGGALDAGERARCRVLEQTLRDEIRGHRLLNDPVRRAVLAHRTRGASVQLLDDGGLDDLSPGALNRLLDELAERLEPLTSARIVVRTAQPGAATAITLVATTPDETAVALGLDDDERVDLWLELPRERAAV